ncbi:3-deoxy-manno-octulosonate cytidylyltransferase [Halothermothrix orenii]|uniref:3-deoxy-manno-octulosonate cytidylyltransferase n=1 Tax=Halothermothrix orenii (strain H 168 / OCM 544 / DSM 9562) TaxID=373903 RepID=B8CZC2_HALOH|nr:3-deoxy-manno-octulosonate cytidylyltransferase [Halothermothrix orenii]ACL70641.1 3-deoxy-D-manno-octulosonate cytidylyltransferase [Halothermothrix orenii H 168]
MNVIAVIPARFYSSRFPGKPLADIKGKPMIEHVYRRVCRVKGLKEVYVATDDDRIYNTVKDFGGNAVMTSKACSSGTDRVAEVVANLDCDIVVNVQGDEPLLEPLMVEQALKPFAEEKNLNMSTLMKEIGDPGEVENPNVVKVVVDKDGYALYFSRSPIPHPRNSGARYYKHIGLYIYRRKFLMNLTQMEQTELEKVESLEQLRVLENGYKIKVVETEFDSIGVDTPEDIARVEKIMEGCN